MPFGTVQKKIVISKRKD